MDPDRKKIVNGVEIAEFYWAGRYVVYVEHRLADVSFEEAVRMLEAGETVPLVER